MNNLYWADPKQRRQVLYLLLLLPLIFAFLAVYHGQDNSWDLRNYHFYNAYSIDTNRLDTDIQMAQVQGYLNPTIDLLFYHLIQNFSPRTATFILGYIHGLTASLLLLLSLLVVRPFLPPPHARLIGALVITAAGCYAPTLYSLAGIASNDITASLFVLAPILLIVHLKNLPEKEPAYSRLMLASAGVLLGMGVGMKLTLLVYAIAMIAALMVTDDSWKSRVEGVIMASAGLLVGLLMTRGPWMWHLWQNFESPLFPFYNLIFESPFYLLENFSDPRYLPKSLADHFLFPFIRGFENSYTAMQKGNHDLRYGIVYLLLAVSLANRLIKSRAPGKKARDELRWHNPERFLMAFFIAAYAVWQLKFSIWRYASPLEQLAPLLVVMLVSRLLAAEKIRLGISALLLVFIALSVETKPNNRLPFKDAFFRIQVPRIENPERAAILVAGGRPWSYLATAFPPAIRFIRISSNMITPGDSTRLVDRIRSAVDSHDGPLYLLTRRRYLAGHLNELQAYGITYSTNQALTINSEHEPPGLFLLPLKRF